MGVGLNGQDEPSSSRTSDELSTRTGDTSHGNRPSKWWLLLLYGGVGVVAYLNKTSLLAWIHEGGSQHVVLLYLIGSFFALVPVIPFGVMGGVMGATYGVWAGGLFNWSVSLTGSTLMFLGFRYLFAERGRRALERFSAVERFHERLEHNAFLAILFARMIPIVPAYVVNVYAALMGVPLRIFGWASALGKIPINFLFAYLGEELVTSRQHLFFAVIGYLVFLFLVYSLYRYWIIKRGSIS